MIRRTLKGNDNKIKSCFLAVPLPEKFQAEFSQLIEILKSQNLGLALAKPESSHITLYYLGDQPESALTGIIEAAQGLTSTINKVELSVGGAATFGGRLPRVLYLEVKYPIELEKYYYKLEKELNQYRKPDHDRFRPHLTLARLDSRESRRALASRQDEIFNKIDRYHWRFPVFELVLYCRDDERGAGYYQSIARMSVDN